MGELDVVDDNIQIRELGNARICMDIVTIQILMLFRLSLVCLSNIAPNCICGTRKLVIPCLSKKGFEPAKSIRYCSLDESR